MSNDPFLLYRVIAVIPRKAMRNPMDLLNQKALSYKLLSNYFQISGYVNILPAIQEDLRDTGFAVAVSQNYYWGIFPKKMIRFVLNDSHGRDTILRYAEDTGCNSDEVESLLDLIPSLRKSL